ncbi:bifunctional demethylmenaquinone methyltransferase/2-methoxy-6-polyprenyl-1,4-benzoquinol methylase UbiE [Bauldia litoralis]|uniref:Ubiquinone/menaquinone biosynthesis C-methyltransferase UbiE n=1 Tax=Bauldia litoralis TaxID=665467 RepID=A0A1G6E1C2_9HYPH|nr:bifunctional demethylmenaquinone methyltransferase/2-methoxy-6-polyprenyl-1,4-benzoquinol methylase UbiE [Bauldia litoralis]SDB51203.1 demethylmenaquinone methyltransferase / 2-methoxy-6-polyprenyl-1,4-benzoquinol methylase [Bauldia litoralis]
MTSSSAGAAARQGEGRAWFGFREVGLDEKQGMVDQVFHQVAGRYDLMNDLMSGGMHRLWKDAMVAWLGPPRRAVHGYSVLDVAGGTGDIGFRIAGRSEGAEVVVADINGEMLKVGRSRAMDRRLDDRVTFVECNAEDLSFPDNHFDAVTIAFGIRNVPRIERALAEARRVLKPGGRFLCLEFSAVDVAGLDKLYDLFSFRVIPALGEMVAGDRESYAYLVESIRQFPNQARFAAMIADAGFSRVDYRNLSGGIAAIHSGWKL